MKPHEQCKRAGLKSLNELSKMTKTSIQTLINWWRKKPSLFEIVVLGGKKKKDQDEKTNI